MKKTDLYPFSNVLWTIVLAILYAVGVAGMAIPGLTQLILPLTPILLLLTTGLLIFFQLEKDVRFWFVAGFIFIASIAFEIAGVKTGWIFGNYYYGPTLGPKVFGVPLMIGINWLMLVISTAMITMRLRYSWWIKAVVAASLMVFLDMWIEPVCGLMDMWYWEHNTAPVRNYIAWWVFAFIFQLMFQRIYVKKMMYYPDNPLAIFVWLFQFLFFLSVNIIHL